MSSPIVLIALGSEDDPFHDNAHIPLLAVEGLGNTNNKLAIPRKLLLHATNVVLKGLGELLTVEMSRGLGQVDLLEGLA
jgi:hypothetical protein